MKGIGTWYNTTFTPAIMGGKKKTKQNKGFTCHSASSLPRDGKMILDSIVSKYGGGTGTTGHTQLPNKNFKVLACNSSATTNYYWIIPLHEALLPWITPAVPLSLPPVLMYFSPCITGRKPWFMLTPFRHSDNTEMLNNCKVTMMVANTALWVFMVEWE